MIHAAPFFIVNNGFLVFLHVLVLAIGSQDSPVMLISFLPRQ